MGTIAKAVNAQPEWFGQVTLDHAHIAILDPKLARIVAAGEGSDEYVTSSQIGAYCLLRAGGYRVDFLHEDDVAGGSLDDYRVLVIPFGYALRRSTAERARDWVHSGGRLIAGMWCGAKDEHGFGCAHNPGLGLDDVFGAEERELVPLRHPQDRVLTNMTMNWGAPITGEAPITLARGIIPNGAARAGQTFPASTYISRLQPRGAAVVVATDDAGAAVVTHNAFGQGRALLVGTMLRRTHQYLVDGLSCLLSDMASDAGVAPTVRLEQPGAGRAEAEVLTGPDGRGLLVLLNAGGPVDKLRATIPQPDYVLAREVESGTASSLARTAEGVVLEVDLGAGDGRAYILERS